MTANIMVFAFDLVSLLSVDIRGFDDQSITEMDALPFLDNADNATLQKLIIL